MRSCCGGPRIPRGDPPAGLVTQEGQWRGCVGDSSVDDCVGLQHRRRLNSTTVRRQPRHSSRTNPRRPTRVLSLLPLRNTSPAMNLRQEKESPGGREVERRASPGLGSFSPAVTLGFTPARDTFTGPCLSCLSCHPCPLQWLDASGAGGHSSGLQGRAGDSCLLDLSFL